MTDTITYQSQNAPAGQEWLAQVIMSNGQKWLVHSYGTTEAEAVEKITDLYENEKSKVTANYQKAASDFNNAKENLTTVKAISIERSGRGSHFVGKVWMIHSFTRAKIRVDQSEVDKYISEGWEKGGPRSK